MSIARFYVVQPQFRAPCPRCGTAARALPGTCGGPVIPRLCSECRAESPRRARLYFCFGGCCTRAGTREMARAAQALLEAEGVWEAVEIVPVSCLDRCDEAPLTAASEEAGWGLNRFAPRCQADVLEIAGKLARNLKKALQPSP